MNGPSAPVGVRPVRHRLIFGTVWVGASKLLAAPVGVAVGGLLARLLTPDALGTYFLAAGVVGLAATVATLGQEQVVVRMVARSLVEARAVSVRLLMGRTFALGAIGALAVASAFLLGGGRVVARLMGLESLYLLQAWLGAWIVALALLRLVAESFRGIHDIRLASLISVAGAGTGLAPGALLILCLGATVAVWGHLSVGGAVAATVACLGVTLVAGSWILLQRVKAFGGPSQQTPTFGVLVRTGLPILVSRLSLFALTQADILILAAYRPPSEVGIYGAAFRLVALAGLPLAIAHGVTPPIIAELHTRGRDAALEKMLRGTATLASLPSLAVLGLFVFAGRRCLEWVYGPGFSEGWPVLVLLGIGRAANVVMGSGGLVLTMTGHERTAMGITLGTSALTFTAALLLVREFGALGVAAAMAAGLMVQNLLRVGAARRLVGVWTLATLSPAGVRAAFAHLGALDGSTEEREVEANQP